MLDIDIKELQSVLQEEEQEEKFERIFKTDYPSVYLYGTGKMKLKVLWSMKDKNIQQNIDFHNVKIKSKKQDGGTFTKKLPCNKVYEEECALCEFIRSQPDSKDVEQKKGGILYAIIKEAETDENGEMLINKGRQEDLKIKIGDLIVLRYPFFVRQKFRELLTEHIEQTSEIFASNESYLIDLVPDETYSYVMNVSLDTSKKDKEFETEEEYIDLLKSLPSLKTQFFDRTDEDLKQVAQDIITKEAEYRKKMFRTSVGIAQEPEKVTNHPECFGNFDEDTIKCSICSSSDECESK